jgi:hypothetical protein
LEPDDPEAQEEGRQREEQRGLWRQGHAGPVLAEPKAWLDEQYGQGRKGAGIRDRHVTVNILHAVGGVANADGG